MEIIHEDWLTVLSSTGKDENHRLWFVLKQHPHSTIVMDGYEGKGCYHQRMSIQIQNCRINFFPKQCARSGLKKSPSTINAHAQWIFSLESRRFMRFTQRYIFLAIDKESMKNWLSHLEPLMVKDDIQGSHAQSSSQFDQIYCKLPIMINLDLDSEKIIQQSDNYAKLENCIGDNSKMVSFDYPVIENISLSQTVKKNHKKKNNSSIPISYAKIDIEKTQAIIDTISDRRYEFRRVSESSGK